VNAAGKKADPCLNWVLRSTSGGEADYLSEVTIRSIDFSCNHVKLTIYETNFQKN
jgi:hypothetical protein